MTSVALGFRAHSGWAACVALAATASLPAVLERRRVELVDPGTESWAKQPYHAAHGQGPSEAEEVVRRAVGAAHERAEREVAAIADRLRARGCRVVALGIALGRPMPDWSVAQILAVHARMHQAEGELFRRALLQAGEAHGLRIAGVPERQLQERAAEALELSADELGRRLAEIGRSAGRPWGRDQKDAALAAWLALRATW
jgi:hypothetical protein